MQPQVVEGILIASKILTQRFSLQHSSKKSWIKLTKSVKSFDSSAQNQKLFPEILFFLENTGHQTDSKTLMPFHSHVQIFKKTLLQ